MSALLGVLGLLTVLVGIFILIVRFFKKKSKKMPLVLVLVGFVSFVIGVSINTDKVESADEKKVHVETLETKDMTSESTEKSEPKKEEKKKKSSASKDKEDVKPTMLGDTLTIGKVSYILNGVESSDVLTWSTLSKEANGVFLIADVTITNNGDDALNLSDDFFTVVHGKAKYESDWSASMYANDYKRMTRELNPGLSTSYKIAFDITQEVLESTDTNILVKTGVWGTQTGLLSTR